VRRQYLETDNRSASEEPLATKKLVAHCEALDNEAMREMEEELRSVRHKHRSLEEEVEIACQEMQCKERQLAGNIPLPVRTALMCCAHTRRRVPAAEGAPRRCTAPSVSRVAALEGCK
jgi:hypothetical protein